MAKSTQLKIPVNERSDEEMARLDPDIRNAVDGIPQEIKNFYLAKRQDVYELLKVEVRTRAKRTPSQVIKDQRLRLMNEAWAVMNNAKPDGKKPGIVFVGSERVPIPQYSIASGRPDNSDTESPERDPDDQRWWRRRGSRGVQGAAA